jgi:hypothetical protein
MTFPISLTPTNFLIADLLHQDQYDLVWLEESFSSQHGELA